jgi:hypothetical protein
MALLLSREWVRRNVEICAKQFTDIKKGPVPYNITFSVKSQPLFAENKEKNGESF